MEAWWIGLTTLNKVFACSALFFTVLFLWQAIGVFAGMDVHSQDIAHDTGMDHPATDSGHAEHHGEGQVAFSLVTLRSLIAFGTLFSWAGTLYLMEGTHAFLAVLYSVVWGLAGMFAVAYLLYRLVRLEETQNIGVWSAIGEEGVVYMNIPDGGLGKVRVTVRGAVNFVNARCSSAGALTAGTKVIVVGVINENTVRVEPVETREGG
jgi:membrane protein implicated in regulation of membrane protease activity